MAEKIIIKGIGGIDGEYDLDIAAMLDFGHPETLTQREAHKIKKATGLRLGELEDAVDSGDSDMVIAFAIVALDRAKKRYDIESLWDAPLGAVVLEADEQQPASDEADDADPLSSDDRNGSPEPNGSNGGGSGNPQSEPHPPSDPSPTGDTTSAMPTSGPASVHPI